MSVPVPNATKNRAERRLAGAPIPGWTTNGSTECDVERFSARDSSIAGAAGGSELFMQTNVLKVAYNLSDLSLLTQLPRKCFYQMIPYGIVPIWMET